MKLKIKTKSKYRKKFIDIHLINTLRFYYSSIKNKNVMQIKTHSRSSTIFPCFEKMTIHVYNGKKFLPLLIQEHHLGLKFGEFIFTRKFSGHKKDGRKVVYKKKKNTPRSYFFHEINSKNILNNKLKYIN
jgi:small subunit ribosomal protein S19